MQFAGLPQGAWLMPDFMVSPFDRPITKRIQADDFPAYVTILLSGHIMAPIIIALVQETALSLAALAAIIVPLMLALMIVFIQPAKGAIIALQWWFGMHGFVKERPAPEASEREA